MTSKTLDTKPAYWDGQRMYSLGMGPDGREMFALAVFPIVAGNLVDHSGSIVSANTPQEAIPANPNRIYYIVQNLSTAVLWISFDGDAEAGSGSIMIAPNGGTMESSSAFVPRSALSIFGTVDGQAFTIWEGEAYA